MSKLKYKREYPGLYELEIVELVAGLKKYGIKAEYEGTTIFYSRKWKPEVRGYISGLVTGMMLGNYGME